MSDVSPTEPAATASASLRLDKWLWFARFLKSRTLAAKLCESGRARINKVIVQKAHQPVRVGDVLTFQLGAHIRVIAVRALGSRRGPAPEAALLYDDLAPPARPVVADRPPADAARDDGAGRPTKAERRATDRLRGRDP
ncbi:MAG: RNA-binding S4 domain-containing protein [Rhodospirillales bacterium]|nr:RNA-binding S4 domain-containing protein [Rhodospirillales bacterium]